MERGLFGVAAWRLFFRRPAAAALSPDVIALATMFLQQADIVDYDVV